MDHKHHRHMRGHTMPSMKQAGFATSTLRMPRPAVVLMIIAFVILHAMAANSIFKAGGFSVKNPYSYLMIGSFLVLAAFKLTYLWHVKHGKVKDSGKKL
jgi:hypothetical protein